MLKEVIPFVFSKSDVGYVNQYHAEAEVCRVLLGEQEIWRNGKLKKWLWIDTGIDCLNHLKSSPHTAELDDPLTALLSRPSLSWLVSRSTVPKEAKHRKERARFTLNAQSFAKPPSDKVNQFVAELLKECAAISGMAWIAVPHVGVCGTGGQNENALNIQLAKAAGNFEMPKDRFLIQSLVLTNQAQYDSKPARNKIVKLAQRLVESSKAKGMWVVDYSLEDQSVTGPMAERLKKLRDLYLELADNVKGAAIVSAGPHWCFNLTLWAIGLVPRPAIGLGNRYQYHWSYGFAESAKDRLVVLPLKRWALTEGLSAWLTKAISTHSQHQAGGEEPAVPSPESVAANVGDGIDGATVAEFQRLHQLLGQGAGGEALRTDRVKQYKAWLNELSSQNANGRRVEYYKQLSGAYITGKLLGGTVGELAAENGPMQRQPGGVAETHMGVVL